MPTTLRPSRQRPRWNHRWRLAAVRCGRGIILAAWLAGIGWAGWSARRLWSQTWWPVREVEVQGCVRLDPGLVRDGSGLQAGQPLFGAPLRTAVDTLRRDPWIAAVRVDRRWMDRRLVLTLVEREPVASVLVGGEPWLADDRGTLIVPQHRTPVPGLPLLAIDVAGRPDPALIRRALSVYRSWSGHPVARDWPLSAVSLGPQPDGDQVAVELAGSGTWVQLGRWTVPAPDADEKKPRRLWSSAPAPEPDVDVVALEVDRVANRLARIQRVLQERHLSALSLDLGNRRSADWVAAQLVPVTGTPP